MNTELTAIPAVPERGITDPLTPLTPVKALTVKAEQFAQLYAQCGNATRAYRAVFDVSPATKPNTVKRMAYELRHDPDVAARVIELKDASAEKAVISTARLRVRQYEIATAPSLVQVRIFNCRYCESDGRHYAWVDSDEFSDAVAVWDAGKRLDSRPSPLGGFTFDPFAPPRPTCRKCMGAGVAVTYLPDTTELDDAAAAAYAGAEVDKYGVITVKQHSQQDAAHELHRMIPGAMAATRSLSANLNVSVPLPENLSPADALAFLETLKPS